MARIPEHEVERLKREVSVQRLAEARGIKLHRHGADLLGLCPFHDDRNPSLVITPGKNLWHCLGACNAGGTAIDWVMRANGISFRHAVELLRAGPSSLSRRSGPAGEAWHGAQAAAARGAGRGRPRAAVAGRGLLQRDAEAVAGGDEVSGIARPEIVGDHRPFPAGLRQPDAGLSACRRRTAPPARRCADGCNSWASCARAATSTSTVRWSSRCSIAAGDVVEMYGRKITPNLREGTPNHCICRVRMRACGTKRRWPPRKKSSCANR